MAYKDATGETPSISIKLTILKGLLIEPDFKTD